MLVLPQKNTKCTFMLILIALGQKTNENSNRLISQDLAQKHFCGICR